MIKIKNSKTGEVVGVKNTGVHEGKLFVFGKGEPTRWAAKNPMFKLTGEILATGAYNKYEMVFVEGMGYELVTDVDTPKKERKPKAPKAPKVDAKPVDVEDVQPEPEPTPAPAPTPVEEQPKPKAKAEKVGNDELKTAMEILSLLKGRGGVDEDAVRQIVREELGKNDVKEVVYKIKVADMPEYEMPDGKEPSPLFNTVLSMVVNDRVIGRFPWLYGPAGSGKSTMARQIADVLGLPFYSVSSLQQKYELEGYSDAVGEFVQTAFYKAMAEGGIFCFDEMSTTSGEVQVAFNTAAAQLVYNFPKMGMVKAHPDFHIIAADNSTGRGGDKRYISRFQLDASTLDRYNFVEVGYTKEHDLFMAAGDKELVTFIEAVRKAIDEANTSYLATPRASKAIKALQATGMSDKDAVWYGLCSGWNKQDIRTIAARLSGANRYFRAIHDIVEGC